MKPSSPMVMNVVMIGALAGSRLTPLEPDDYRLAIVERVPRTKDVNLRAFK